MSVFSPKTIAVALALALSGCAGIPPPYHDPFAGASSAPSPYKNLVIGVVPTDNTNQTTQYVYNYGSKYRGAEGVIKSLDQFTEAFTRDFKSSVKAADMAAAVAQGADVVLILDIRMKLPLGPFKATVDASARVQAPDGRLIDEVSVHGEHSAPIFPTKHQGSLALEEAAQNLESALLASPKLQSFAQRRGPQAPAPAIAAAKHSGSDEPQYRKPENEDDFAIVVGIEKYSSLPPADFAERDASAMKNHLLALGYPERNVIVLMGQNATKTGIEKYVESWLPRNVHENSRVLVYFSGHGAPDPVSGEAYLVPWDGDPKFLDTTGYPISRLYRKLNELKAKQVIVAMDSCFSGAGGRSVMARGARPLVSKIDLGDSDLGKVVVLAAAGGDEITGSIESEEHGLFTYQLLKGLNASHGDATVASLFGYLKPKVQDAARRDNRDQTPQLLPPSALTGAAVPLR